MAWLLNIVYLLGLAAFLPRMLVHALRGKYSGVVSQRLLGRVPVRTGTRPCVWFHAGSLGEVRALSLLVPQFQHAHPGWDCVVTTSTTSGQALARQQFGHLPVACMPIDFTWAAAEAVRRIRPDLFVMVEAELCPNLTSVLCRQGVKLAMINGRLSPRARRMSRWLRPFFRPAFAALELAAVQSPHEGWRCVQAGVKPQAVHVTGSLKFDGAQSNRRNPRTKRLAHLAGLNSHDIILLAGSTQAGEESVVIAAFRRLAAQLPRLRLLLVPRHRERFAHVARLLDKSGLCWQRRSTLETEGPNPRARVLLVDTQGELPAWWGLAQIAFVGGSLTSRGGQSMIEPAAYGAAVAFGPHTRNFRDVVSLLLQSDAAVIVRDERELTEFVRRCATDRQFAGELGSRASDVVAQQRGATTRTLLLLESLVTPIAASRRAPSRILLVSNAERSENAVRRRSA